jgi:hypothetical protein
MKIFIYILFAILLCPVSLRAEPPIYVAGIELNKEIYDKMVSEKGGNPLEIHDYSSPHASRPAIALIIMQQALSLGGMNAKFEFIPYPNYTRCISELKKGRVDILATDMWEDQFDNTVYKTSPFINKGEFEKGIYACDYSELLKKTPNLSDLIQHVPIVGMSWELDRKTLRRMGNKIIQTAPTYPLIFEMLARKRADYTILEFPKDINSSYLNTCGLQLVKGVKIKFPYSRHFMISKKRKRGKKIYEALEKGLQIMRNNGTLYRALHQANIINDRVRDWKIIWPEKPQNN